MPHRHVAAGPALRRIARMAAAGDADDGHPQFADRRGWEADDLATTGGATAGLRVSAHIYNTLEEVERVVDALAAMPRG